MASGDAPYRGLASFGPQDAPWFFGREDVAERLVELVTGWGIGAGTGLPLIVVGPSGSGKSSLLAAGLMPRLTGPVTLIVPTATPAAGPRYVIVDKFEAVFTRCQDEDQRREFITAVCDLAGKATVILALRADFYDRALRYPGLAVALQSRQVVLGPMTAEQVRQAIVELARRPRPAAGGGGRAGPRPGKSGRAIAKSRASRASGGQGSCRSGVQAEPLPHRGALVGVEALAVAAGDELVHPRRGQLHHQLTPDEHREDLPAVAQRATAEPAAARRRRHAVHPGELVDQVLVPLLGGHGAPGPDFTSVAYTTILLR